MRVVVWNEFRHERQDEAVARIYPRGLHEAIAEPLREAGFDVTTATLDEPDHGLPEDRLAETDVLVWWGHRAHGEVPDDLAQRIQLRVVKGGMGFIALHSSHFAKPFMRLMGTDCYLKHRVAGERERVWVVDPGHAIAAGISDGFDLPHEEMYGEPFDVPAPDELVFISWFEGGEVFRSGCAWRRGLGRVFYFRPGHETYPTYHDANVRRVLVNAVGWAAAPADLRPPVRGRRERTG